MGLVRASDTITAPPEDDTRSRAEAAHALGLVPGNEVEIGHLLNDEEDPCVREALFGALVEQGTMAAARELSCLLAGEDAVLRSGALRALTALPDHAHALIAELTAAQSPNLRQYGALLAGEVPGPDTEAQLLAWIAQETDANVCATIIDVLLSAGLKLPAEHGALLALRFPNDPLLQFLLRSLELPVGAGSAGLK